MKIPDIKELMQTSCNYSLNMRSNSWLTELLTEDFESAWVIIPEGRLQVCNPEMKSLKEKYSIGAMCQLGEIYNATGVKMALVLFTKKSVSDIWVSIYNGKTRLSYAAKDIDKGKVTVATIFTPEYLEYIGKLEAWLSGKTVNCKNAEFKKVSNSDTEEGLFYPGYFTDRAITVRKLLETEKTEKLSNLADILVPAALKEEKMGKCLSYKDLQYPLDCDSVELRPITTVKLEKGDVIIPSMNFEYNKPYLFQGASEDIYASRNMFVVRNSKILPEYLCLYLSSETARCVFETRSVGTMFVRLTRKTIDNFPVIMPKQDDSNYIIEFDTLMSWDKRVYSSDPKGRLLKYFTLWDKGEEVQKVENIEDILNIEVANNIKVHNEEVLRAFLTDDLRELNTCYKNKAYKATLILAGSILEAVLIDWLSEIKHIDYFEEDYIVKDKKTGKDRKAELFDYINEIKYIERPHWMEEASKAHEIRKKRNLVHAKLCIKSDEINENVCKEVIGYLKDVLKTRGAV